MRRSAFTDLLDLLNAFPKGPYIGMAISALFSLPAFYIKYAILNAPTAAATSSSAALKAGMTLVVYKVVMYILFVLGILTFLASIIALLGRKLKRQHEQRQSRQRK